jgi:LysM repeat protein
MKALNSLLIIVFLIICEGLSAQNQNYQIKKIAGKEYILYPVQAGEGLYGIARKFEVTLDKLNELNPDAANGLTTGQILLIPSSKKTKTEVVETNKTEKSTVLKSEKAETNFIEHLVEKKQTLFAISRKYDISVEELKKLNPDLENGLKTGMTLRIPCNKSIDDKKHKNKCKDKIEAETKNIQIAETPKPIEPEVVKAKHTVDDVRYLTRLVQNVKPNTTPLKIAILLPLVIENAKTDAVNERFQEFYAGFLLAANEAKNKGVSIEIYTFDTEKTEDKIIEVLRNQNLKNVDLIIGPAYTNQISLVSEFAKENKINCVIPFSSKVADLATNPYLFQFNATNFVETEYLCNLLNKNTKPENIVFIDLATVTASDNGFEFSQNLKNSLTAKNKPFQVIEMATEQLVQSSTVFDKEKSNVIIFNTDKFSGIFPYLSFLNSKAMEYDIQLYEQFSWKNQNAQVKFKSFSIAPFKPLINDDDLKQYNSLFNGNFGWKKSSNNPQYDVLGYDLGNYFIALLYEFGPQFSWDKKQLPLASGIQSFLKFERNNVTSGFVNKQLYQHEK